mgnify:CR=1 FL=1
MCCDGSIELTQKFLNKKKTIKVYKLVKKQRGDEFDGRLSKAFILRGVYQYFEYKPGVIKSNTPTYLIQQDKAVVYGIHVWLSKKSAEIHLKTNTYCRKIVELTANIDDLIAVGRFDGGRQTDNAVFSRVTLSQQEYDKALGKKVKK